MPEYLVSVHTSTRGVVRQRVVAADRQGVANALGVLPSQVLRVEPVLTHARIAKGSSTRTAFPLRLFSQELAVLLDSGIPLLEALETLHEKEARSAVAATLGSVIASLRQGLPLSAALAVEPAAFDELMLAIVSASERTGQLPSALRQHAQYLAWMEGLRSRIVAAAIYPTLLLVVGGAVVMFLLLFVLPRFAGILDGMGHDLPWASVALLALGRWAGANPAVVFTVGATLVMMVIAIANSQDTRGKLMAWCWRAPWLGGHLRVLALARLYRTLGMLLSAGVPVVQGMRIVQKVVAAPYRASLTQALEQVTRGGRLSDALESHGLCTPVARRMVRVGERSGQVAEMLERAASFHDEEVVRFTEFITRAISPALMLVMGVVIGGIVVLMYLPIFQLVEQVQ
jgi:general secretion pathway protein F